MRIHEYGDATVIRPDDLPVPVPGLNEVLLRVAATSFNPSEIGLRRGWLSSIVPVTLPYTLGYDVAGTVVAQGSGVVGPAVGDTVIGRLDGGAAADYAIAPAAVLVAAPTTLPLAESAAMPLAGVTAWQAVFEHAQIVSGQRLLINGTGAIGRYAVQLGRQAGAHVIATARPGNADLIRQLGADEILDPAAIPSTLDEPVDAVLNLAPVDPARLTEVAKLLRPGGVLVSAATPVGALADEPFRAVHFVVRNDPGDLAALVKLVDARALDVQPVWSRPLADLADVHREAENGSLLGKTLLYPSLS
jgi:NADPH:quinone reductase-like Zn-dependent oxidoreductase